MDDDVLGGDDPAEEFDWSRSVIEGQDRELALLRRAVEGSASSAVRSTCRITARRLGVPAGRGYRDRADPRDWPDLRQIAGADGHARADGAADCAGGQRCRG